MSDNICFQQKKKLQKPSNNSASCVHKHTYLIRAYFNSIEIFKLVFFKLLLIFLPF